MIQVEALVKRYRKAKRNAVDGISFEIGAGEFFALLGPNGAGKTTTLSILTTTLAPTAGRAAIDGQDVATEAPAVRRTVGPTGLGPAFQRPARAGDPHPDRPVATSGSRQRESRRRRDT